jgi:hypothetical protein
MFLTTLMPHQPAGVSGALRLTKPSPSPVGDEVRSLCAGQWHYSDQKGKASCPGPRIRTDCPSTAIRPAYLHLRLFSIVSRSVRRYPSPRKRAAIIFFRPRTKRLPSRLRLLLLPQPSTSRTDSYIGFALLQHPARSSLKYQQNTHSRIPAGRSTSGNVW